MTLRLGVDARDLALDNQGIGRYARALLRRMAADPQVELTLLLFGPFAFRHRRALAATLRSDRFTIATRPRGCDVVWHPWNGTFFNSSAPSVVSMHDAMPFVHPDPDPKRREHQQKPFRRSVQGAARFITVSAFARDEISGVFGLTQERFEVIHHGVEPFFSPGEPDERPPDLRTPYILFVGDTAQEPPKNFPLLYAAFRRAFPDGSVRLAVAGPTDPALEGTYYAGLFRGDAAGEGDTRLRALYRGAAALCVPSYHETFGMPMLEAMACGTPVVASHATALPEIGGDAALYAGAHDVDAWAAALARIVREPGLRSALRETGIARACTFRWEQSAERHLAVFRSCL